MTNARDLDHWEDIWQNMPPIAWEKLEAFLRDVKAYEGGQLPDEEWPSHALRESFSDHVVSPGHFIVVFDWMTWKAGEAMVGEPRPLESADAKTCCMFLSAIERAERFTTGIQRRAFENGAIQTAARQLLKYRPNAD